MNLHYSMDFDCSVWLVEELRGGQQCRGSSGRLLLPMVTFHTLINIRGRHGGAVVSTVPSWQEEILG